MIADVILIRIEGLLQRRALLNNFDDRRCRNNPVARGVQFGLLHPYLVGGGEGIGPRGFAIAPFAVPPFDVIAALGVGFVPALDYHMVAIEFFSGFAGTSGSGELATKGIATLASLTMILLAALLCNYGRGKCLIDVGTEGYRRHGKGAIRGGHGANEGNGERAHRDARQAFRGVRGAPEVRGAVLREAVQDSLQADSGP